MPSQAKLWQPVEKVPKEGTLQLVHQQLEQRLQAGDGEDRAGYGRVSWENAQIFLVSFDTLVA